MRRITFAILTALVLVGCGSNPPAPAEPVEQVIFHPTRPAPVRPYPARQWVYIAIDGRGYMSLELEKAADLVIYLEDVLRYVKSQNATLCQYRKELDEPECSE